MRTRRPAAWGFYPSSADEEKRAIEGFFVSEMGADRTVQSFGAKERRIVGIVVPHAGYSYSGPIAAHAYFDLFEDGNPETFVFLGPSHAGYPGFSTMVDGVWRMPMGDVDVDSELAKAIVGHSEFVDVNPEAHDREHSIEVQLPFLQHIYCDKFKIVPITVGYSDFDMCRDVGVAVAEAAKEKHRDVVVVASTDFTHYGPYYGYMPAGKGPLEKILKFVYDVDKSLIDMILALDAKNLVKTVEDEGYTMCGSFAVATMIEAAKEFGCKETKLLKYATSYDMRGSTDAIVGYGTIKLTK